MSIRRVALFGFALPERRFLDVASTDRSMPTQTQRFGWSLVWSLQAAGISGHLVSVAPIRDYPHNGRMLVGGGQFSDGDWNGREIPFVNFSGLKHLTRYAGAVAHTRRDLRRVEIDAVVVHGVNSAMIWAGLNFAQSRRVPCVVVLTDPPSLRTPYDNFLTGLMKRVDRRAIHRGLSAVSGVIALTSRLAEDFAPGKPSLLMEGIASRAPTFREAAPGRTPIVLYAGGLRDGFGVMELVAASRDSEWDLEIFGKGPLEQGLRLEAKACDNVHFHGLASPDQLQEAYARADLLVNPRPVDQSFVPYSFPSKLLEYLASGTPALTTRLPSIPEDYWPHLVASGDSVEDLRKTITAFFRVPGVDRQRRGLEAAHFIVKTRGIQAQGQRIRAFLEEVDR